MTPLGRLMKRGMGSTLLGFGCCALLAGCGGGGTPPVPVDPDPEVPIDLLFTTNLPLLRDRAVLLNYELEPLNVAFPRSTVPYVVTIEYTTDNGTSWADATEIRTTGSEEQRPIPIEFRPGFQQQLQFFWDADADLPIGAESRAIAVELRLVADQIGGAGEGVSPELAVEVDWSRSGVCAVSGPRIAIPNELVYKVGDRVNRQLDASGGDLPLTWTMNDAMHGGLTLDPTGAITGTAELSDTLYLVTVTDNCAAHQRKDQQWVRVRILPPDCEPLRFDVDTALPLGRVGVTYSSTLDLLLNSDGKGLRTWSLVNTTLPRGLTLEDGVLGGRPEPATAGVYSVRFQVQDSCDPEQSEERSYVLTISN